MTMQVRVDDNGHHIPVDENGNWLMVERHFQVEDEFVGLRLDHYLKRKLQRLSRNKIQKIIGSQLIRCNGLPTKNHSRVMAGEQLIIRRRARPEPPCPREFTVVFEDEYMLVVNKPSGLPVHCSARYYFNTLTYLMRERFPGKSLHLCHRIDKETSGVLVVAKDAANATYLKRQFQYRRVDKSYLALVDGVPPWEGEYTIDKPLGLIQDESALIKIRMTVCSDAAPAQTKVRVLETRGDRALVLCTPITGRQHQIRAHLASEGFPIVGDKLYGHGDQAFADYCEHGLTAELLARFGMARHALHAHSLTIRHPRDQTIQRFQIELPQDMREFFYNQVSRRTAA